MSEGEHVTEERHKRMNQEENDALLFTIDNRIEVTLAKKRDFWKIVSAILLSLLTGALGFGASEKFKSDGLRGDQIRNSAQLTSIKEMIETQVTSLHQTDVETDNKMKILQTDMLDRVKGITETMQNLIKQNTEVIAILKVQNNIRP